MLKLSAVSKPETNKRQLLKNKVKHDRNWDLTLLSFNHLNTIRLGQIGLSSYKKNQKLITNECKMFK